MLERDGYIAGVPCWIDTSQPDPEAATTFYGGLFGWDLEDVMPADAGGHYYMARLRGGDVAAIGSQPPEAPEAPAVWNTYIWVDSADDAAASVRAAGGEVVSEPFDVMDAGRMAVCTDPEGAAFCLWQAKSHKGARIVNEHGALNFNVLNTRNVERAKEFYGSVFGWETLEAGAFNAWTLPGYGDFLERSEPGIRERMEGTGAPTGFVDVVAALVPLGDDQPQVPAHWGVTFGVDDADATAATASELGGEVVMPPVDAPWVRMTVITDPQGATFTASQFVIENKDLGSHADPMVA